ncbi:hypothetical protein [Synechococcus sp. CCY9201]|uniref:hypothetical protein n=1 Tax=Synechococcus sp. CCY9201 TaxID=174697 RepID=UPI002B204480|nr:hypothetical protein [Synechococcus sp. CCY9201]
MADPAYCPSPASRRDLERGTWGLRWVRWRARGGGGGGCRSRGPEPEGPVGLDNEGRRLDRQARQRIAQAVAGVLAQQGIHFASEGSLRAFGREVCGLHFSHTEVLVLPPTVSVHTRTNCVCVSSLRPRHFRGLVQFLSISSSDPSADASPRGQRPHPLAVAVLALVRLGGLSLSGAVSALQPLIDGFPEHGALLERLLSRGSLSLPDQQHFSGNQLNSFSS